MAGIFISFEGIDYSGKSEQSRRLYQHLRDAGYDDVELLREPGGVAIAERIRKVVLDSKNASMNPRTELLLYSAARAQITAERIVPALQAGTIVIADRYVDSTTVYQGAGRDLDREFVMAVNAFATASVLPNLTVLIDLPWEVARQRQGSDRLPPDRLERESAAFHERVRQAYLQLASNDPVRFAVIDGNQPADPIEREVADIVAKRFDLKLLI